MLAVLEERTYFLTEKKGRKEESRSAHGNIKAAPAVILIVSVVQFSGQLHRE